jgi:predicted cupin superfamily sugar epimerase
MNIPKILVEKYSLQPHPEGGWYTQNYKSAEIIPSCSLPIRFGGNRVLSTAIFFLLEKDNFSAFHRIKSDECWHFYLGDPLEILILLPNNTLQTVILSNRIEENHHFQFIVPANCWFASRPASNSNFSFVGCTVAPGFDFDDFEMAKADDLVAAYPQHQSIIKKLCR